MTRFEDQTSEWEGTARGWQTASRRPCPCIVRAGVARRVAPPRRSSVLDPFSFTTAKHLEKRERDAYACAEGNYKVGQKRVAAVTAQWAASDAKQSADRAEQAWEQGSWSSSEDESSEEEEE